LGDFNADGFPDVALAGGVGYAVFDGKKLTDGSPVAGSLLWIRPTQDCSSAVTGSTLFDFDGDGKVEAVYADEVNLHVYDSATGTELFTTCNTSGTLIEYPLVADLDNDGQPTWWWCRMPMRLPVWATAPGTRACGCSRAWTTTGSSPAACGTKHAYVVTNIEEDGTVPSPARTTGWKLA
jgi:hypothetical protein